MVLGIYLIIIITAMIISKKVAGKVLKAVTVATNYVFILTVLTVLLVRQNYDAANFIIGFIRCAMASIEMIAFKDLPSVASTLIATTSIQSSLIFQMYVISFAASIMTAYAVVLALFGKLVRKAVLKFRSLINKKQYVLVGEPEIAATLLKDILNNDPKAFFIYVSDDNKIKDGLWLKEDLSFFDRMREGVEYHIMLIDSKNALSLTKIIDEKANGKKIFVTAVVDNDSIRFEDIKTKNIDAYLVSKEQLITHSIFKEMRPIDVAVKNDMFELSTGLPLLKRPIGVCVIGFGDFGKEYLLSTYENSQFKTVTGEKPFHALVIDEAMYYKEQAFYVDAPHFKDSGEIIFINTKAHTFDYFDAIVKDSRGIQQVLIATRDSEQNVDIALKLLRL